MVPFSLLIYVRLLIVLMSYKISKALEFNYFEIFMPKIENELVTLVSSSDTFPEPLPARLPSAFDRLMQGSSDSNRTMVSLKPYPKSNKDRLFNESAKYVNELGGKFSATARRSGGQVHSVVSALCDVIWTVDNQMSRFIDL